MLRINIQNINSKRIYGHTTARDMVAFVHTCFDIVSDGLIICCMLNRLKTLALNYKRGSAMVAIVSTCFYLAICFKENYIENY